LLIVRQIVLYTVFPCPFLAKPHPSYLFYLCPAYIKDIGQINKDVTKTKNGHENMAIVSLILSTSVNKF